MVLQFPAQLLVQRTRRIKPCPIVQKQTDSTIGIGEEIAPQRWKLLLASSHLPEEISRRSKLDARVIEELWVRVDIIDDLHGLDVTIIELSFGRILEIIAHRYHNHIVLEEGTGFRILLDKIPNRKVIRVRNRGRIIGRVPII